MKSVSTVAASLAALSLALISSFPCVARADEGVTSSFSLSIIYNVPAGAYTESSYTYNYNGVAYPVIATDSTHPAGDGTYARYHAAHTATGTTKAYVYSKYAASIDPKYLMFTELTAYVTGGTGHRGSSASADINLTGDAGATAHARCDGFGPPTYQVDYTPATLTGESAFDKQYATFKATSIAPGATLLATGTATAAADGGVMH